MCDSFWHACSESLKASRRNDPYAAVHLMEVAESVLRKEDLAEQICEKRNSYMDRLKAHMKWVSSSLEHPPEITKTSPQESNTTNKAKDLTAHLTIERLKNRIQKLEREKCVLIERIQSMPSIDPLCIRDPEFTWTTNKPESFGIIVFGHTRVKELDLLLESLRRQDALQYTEVWLDGFQGNQVLKQRIQKTTEVVGKYPVKHLHTQSGNFGFRKMLILGLVAMCKKYRDILILEDDCFPTRDAVSIFKQELDIIRNNRRIFSAYGHHFLMESENRTCPRFQGWGWATTSEKLMPLLRQLIDCYSMSEEKYLEFVSLLLTPDVKAKIDVTPPRQPSYTLEKFFAWDETICLLTALNHQVHKPTIKRTIYNCGMGDSSTHFKDTSLFRSPPFNLISPDEAWEYF
jgi:hypothetical protein